MNIKFSRHAKRRARLYKIPEEEITRILKKVSYPDGKYEVVEHAIGQKNLLKIVFSIENETITVITNYPLKKAIKK